ncbi:MAG: ABC transporter substrate-binding protein [Candidatus Fluviicola riflensis]|nr:MAG: ABC transporter substrate-binding protein [Candidatus Fluviicola riflensis]OGS79106.1 MAG: ABC transporter substrate-binding protein [Candidatus Fluviicola riflensis]OGS86538.1 MAG: ABC transporter substrate-binding protein [Fluviicola sp. RIFCSPHIGHO2_01_FULL_43_53]OGS88987.1 MAG: ABC transporter substrate-binding protein [Fluviicola sp. RIFCSPHIGHO2_12_FULL_43_24]
MPKIGVLLPRSSYYDMIGFDIHEGLRSGLAQAGREDIRIITENIGFGADKNSVYRAAERMLLDENIAVVFAYLTQRSAQLLRPLFMAANRLLIVLDAGANLPQEWPTTPNILYHSLHNSLGAWLSGKMAVQDGYSEGGMVTGYYDGGYLHTAAITFGFQQNGGAIAFNHATGYVKEDFSMTPLLDFRAEKPDSCLLSLFSGDFNEWFFRDLNEVYSTNCPPVYLAPFSFEEMMLEKAEYPGERVQGVASWSSELENAANKQFCEVLTDSGKTPNLFSLLGWEAASLAIFALEAMETNKNNGRAATETLKSKTFESPRGMIRFHDASNTTLAPMYKAKVVNNGNNFCKLVIQEELTDIALAYDELFALNLDGAISGWYNSYTCN